MSVEGQVQIKMKNSVGTLRSQGTYWVEPDRAARLVAKNLAAYLASAPAPVALTEALEMMAQEMRDRHRLNVAPADPSRDATAHLERHATDRDLSPAAANDTSRPTSSTAAHDGSSAARAVDARHVAEGVKADGAKSDQSARKARPGRRTRDGDGSGD